MCWYLPLDEGVPMQESKNITLKVNKELYDKYRALCKKRGWIVSRQVEIMMEGQLKQKGEL